MVRNRYTIVFVAMSCFIFSDISKITETKSPISCMISQRIGNYELIRELGHGTFAKVWMGKHLLTQQIVAVKIVERAELDTPEAQTRFSREMSLLKRLKHPFIAELFEVIQTETAFYLIMEMVEHGNMLDHVNMRGRLDEQEAQRFFCELISALEYLHNEKYVAHRDLKAENILLDRNNNIRLIDFGLSNAFTKACPNLTTACGSPAYAAPEMIQGHPYTKAADVWSAGVVLYAMVCGSLPFEDDNLQRLLQKVVYTEVQFPEGLSGNVTDLLKQLLDKNPEKRITLARIREHPWISQSRHAFLMDFKLGSETGGVEKDIISRMSAMGVDCRGLSQMIIGDVWNGTTAIYRILRKTKLTEHMTGIMAKMECIVPTSVSVSTDMGIHCTCPIGDKAWGQNSMMGLRIDDGILGGAPTKRRMSRPMTAPTTPAGRRMPVPHMFSPGIGLRDWIPRSKPCLKC